MSRMRNLALTFALPLLLVSAAASAHFDLKQPPPPSPTSKDGKGPVPCGPDQNAGVVTPVQGGHEIDLSLNETTVHGGFYRVALSIKARSEIPVDNVVYDKNNVILPANGQPLGTSDHADFQTTPKFPILADHLFPHPQAGGP